MKKILFLLAVTTATLALNAQNLVVNPGFDTDLTGWNDYGGSLWTTSEPGTGITPGSLTFLTTGWGHGIEQDIVATPGSTYTLTFQAKVTGLLADPQVGGLEFYNGGTSLGDNKFSLAGNTFTLYTITATAPAGTTKAKIWVWNADETNTMFYDDFSLTIGTGIENQKAVEFSVSPNPSTEYLNINFASNYESAKISISDLAGKSIYRTMSSGSSSLRIATSEFAKGIYILTVENKGSKSNQKLIIQ